MKHDIRSQPILPSCLRVLFPLAMLGATSFAARAQSGLSASFNAGAVHFKAPIYLGSVAAAPVQMGIPQMLYLQFADGPTGDTWAGSGITGVAGSVSIPSGYLPTESNLYLVSPRTMMMRETPTGDDSWTQGTISGLHVDWSTSPPTLSLEDSVGGTPLWTTSELNLHRHVNTALAKLDLVLGHAQHPTPALLLYVSHLPNDAYGSKASYTWSPSLGMESIVVYANSWNPDQGRFGRSFSVIAHECAHRFVKSIYAQGSPDSPPPELDEGFADFLASVVTGSPVIGAGLTGAFLPRDLSTLPMPSLPDLPGDPHIDGYRLASALYQTRLYYVGTIPGGFLALLRPLLDQKPSSLEDVLYKLLVLDDDDTTLSNGTPNDWPLYYGFTRTHGIHWPDGVPIP